MADLSLREQLQPGLLDRLTDNERFVTEIQVAARLSELARLRLKVSELGDILASLGHKAIAAPAPPSSEEEHEYWFAAPGRSAGLQQIKDMVIKPPGAPAGVVLGTFCRVRGVRCSTRRPRRSTSACSRCGGSATRCSVTSHGC